MKEENIIKIDTLESPKSIIPINTENYQQEYLYGKSDEKLRAKQILDLPSGGVIKIGTFDITSTGNVSITGIGFTPKMVKFTGVANFNGGGAGAMTTTSQWAMFWYASGSSSTNAHCIWIQNTAGTTACWTEYVSMDADGFTINCTFFQDVSHIAYEAYA